eukprot:CAMPEP_0197000608 /NCGR_PEP_ID=MMETSP1380-20130617/5503_1 /TAXON_ID=5936 /ORGANISM="Euplotes crassus, Strain CT5" /LENGTH=224 /DNA_ID=CAMNT_0042417955 /DNA_START=19 /DNA_END=694 /DNA_ORIENTATION=-
MGKEYSKEKLVDAILSGDECKLDKFLEQHPELTNVPLTGGNTNPICRASFLGKRSMIAILLKHGGDINIRCGGKGNTGLMWAAWRNYSRTIEFLIDKGADVEITNFNGETALDISIYRMSYESALLQNKQGLQPKEPEFYLPKLAIEFDVKKFINLLIEEKEVEDLSIFKIRGDLETLQAVNEEELKIGDVGQDKFEFKGDPLSSFYIDGDQLEALKTIQRDEE